MARVHRSGPAGGPAVMEDALRILWMVARGMTPENAAKAMGMIEELSQLGTGDWFVQVALDAPYNTGEPFPSRRALSIATYPRSTTLWTIEAIRNYMTFQVDYVARWNEDFDITLPTSVTGERP